MRRGLVLSIHDPSLRSGAGFGLAASRNRIGPVLERLGAGSQPSSAATRNEDPRRSCLFADSCQALDCCWRWIADLFGSCPFYSPVIRLYVPPDRGGRLVTGRFVHRIVGAWTGDKARFGAHPASLLRSHPSLWTRGLTCRLALPSAPPDCMHPVQEHSDRSWGRCRDGVGREWT